MSLHQLAIVLAAGAAILIVAIAAVRISTRVGLPSLLAYMLIGLAVGTDELGMDFESMELARILGYVALVLILAEGGLTTSWAEIKPSVAPAALLSTLGVAVSVVVVAIAARYIFNLDWSIALLLGAILASTDAAAVFSVLRGIPLPTRLTGMLEAESGFNDAPVVLLTVALSDAAARGNSPNLLGVTAITILELLGGAVIGIVVGRIGAAFSRRLAAASSGLYPLAIMAWVILSYGLAVIGHTSGFLAAYLTALVLGNSNLPHRAAYRGFAQALGWLAQIGLFVMIGMLAAPSALLDKWWQGITLGLVLLLVARPLAVVASTAPFRVPWRDQLFLSWAGLRGAVPIVLATVPVIMGVPDITWIFNEVFVLVVVFTLVQAPTLPWVARRLRVVEEDRAVNLDVESLPLDRLGADLLEVTIGETSRMHGVELFELRLPPGAEVALVVRDDEGFVPSPTSMLRHGDQLLIVTTAAARRAAERQLHAVDRVGRLARWHLPRPAGRDDARHRPPAGSTTPAGGTDGPDRGEAGRAGPWGRLH